MIEIIKFTRSIMLLSPKRSRKYGTKLCSRDFSIWIKVGDTYSHESKLTRKFDVKFHLCRLIRDIIEDTKCSGIWCFFQNLYSIINHHFCHMGSDKSSFHICSLDSIHGSDTDTMCIKISIIKFF